MSESDGLDAATLGCFIESNLQGFLQNLVPKVWFLQDRLQEACFKKQLYQYEFIYHVVCNSVVSCIHGAVPLSLINFRTLYHSPK